MAQMSKYLRNKLIDHIVRSAAFGKPATLAVALFTADPTDEGTGPEVSGNNYARAVLAPSDTNYFATQGGTTGPSSGASGVSANAEPVVFPIPSGTGWGLVTHVGIFDATNGGNLLMFAPLATPKTINNADLVTFQPGQVQITVS